MTHGLTKSIPIDDDVTLGSDSSVIVPSQHAVKTYVGNVAAPIANGVTNGDSHDHSGGDGAAIVEAAITLADNTTNDVSTSKHGLVPKAPNDTAKYLRGDATWATAVNTIQEEGSNLTARSKLNFVGTSVTAADDSGNSATKVTIKSQWFYLCHNNANTVPASTTHYQFMGINGAAGTTERGNTMPTAGTMRNMYVRCVGTQPASGSLVFTMMVGGIASALVVTFAANDTTQTKGDTTHSVTIAQGDAVDIQMKNNATAASIAVNGITIEFDID